MKKLLTISLMSISSLVMADCQTSLTKCGKAVQAASDERLLLEAKIDMLTLQRNRALEEEAKAKTDSGTSAVLFSLGAGLLCGALVAGSNSTTSAAGLAVGCAALGAYTGAALIKF